MNQNFFKKKKKIIMNQNENIVGESRKLPGLNILGVSIG